MEPSLKVAWIKRIAESSNASWKMIPNQALSQYGGLEFLIECEYDPKLRLRLRLRERPGILPRHFTKSLA